MKQDRRFTDNMKQLIRLKGGTPVTSTVRTIPEDESLKNNSKPHPTYHQQRGKLEWDDKE